MKYALTNILLVWARAMDALGYWGVSSVRNLWSILHFKWDLLRAVGPALVHRDFALQQYVGLGGGAIKLVILSAFFTGGVAAYQMAYQFSDIVPEMYIGMAVGKAVLVELGPILTGMVMVGQIGAAMCAELGHMKVNEQVDAMSCLNLDPNRYLYAPRVLASVLLLPVLNVLSSLIAIVAAYGIAWMALVDYSWDTYVNGIRLFFDSKDIWVGVLKSFCFGYILSFYACYYGSKADGGSAGVGRAIQTSVVRSMTTILIVNLLISHYLL